MEKQRTATISEFCRRLLILFSIFFISTNLWAAPSEDTLPSLYVIPVSGQNLYADTDIQFELFIPNIDSAKVKYETPSDTDSITYKKIRCINSESNIYGTSIQLWINFSEEGSFTLPPLKINVQNKKYEIPFENVEISLDPQKQRPVMLIEFSDGTVVSSQDDSIQNPVLSVPAGEKIIFKTQMEYVLQLISEKYDLPLDSIFTRTKVFEPADGPYHEKDTIGTIFPVSQYEWTPLAQGTVTFPEIKLNVISYTGIKTEIRLPQFYIQVLPPVSETAQQSDDIFEQAFSEPEKTAVSEPVKSTVISQEDCEKLAELRSKERHSLFGSARKNRVDFEKTLGLPATQKEFQVPVFYILLFFAIVFAVLLVIAILHKKISYSILSGAMFLFFTVGVIYAHNKISNQFAISKGCTIQSIPEVKVESKSELPAGSLIQIKEKSSGWIYIELGETCGWCHEDEVVVIK